HAICHAGRYTCFAHAHRAVWPRQNRRRCRRQTAWRHWICSAMTYAQRLAALASILLLPSCTMVGPIGIGPTNFGEAASRNVAAQTVNPNAPTDSAPLDFEAQRVEAAQRR